jgi:hypothetical protein
VLKGCQNYWGEPKEKSSFLLDIQLLMLFTTLSKKDDMKIVFSVCLAGNQQSVLQCGGSGGCKERGLSAKGTHSLSYSPAENFTCILINQCYKSTFFFITNFIAWSSGTNYV